MGHLSSLEGRLVRDGTHYGHHDAFAARPASLAVYLQGALLTAAHALYPAAFIQIRAALEHHAADRLLFLADRYEQLLKIDEDKFEEWRASRDEWPEGVRDIRRNSRNQKVIEWDAPKVTKPDGSDSGLEFSPYYGFMQEYDPFSPDVRDAYGDQAIEEAIEGHVKAQKRLWGSLFTWGNIRHNLVLNSLINEAYSQRLDVHYKFLSVFVHPVSLNMSGGGPEREHCASELVLLYVCFLAIEELLAFAQVVQRQPVVGLRGWGEVETILVEAERFVRHGWFPGRSPVDFDRLDELERRSWEAEDQGADSEAMKGEPIEDALRRIPENEVRYYVQPLSRLVDYHNKLSDSGYLMPFRTELDGGIEERCPLRLVDS